METRLQERLHELKKFEAEVRTSMAAAQNEIKEIQEAMKLNQQDMMNLQLESRETKSSVDNLGKKFDVQATLLEEIRAAIMGSKEKGKQPSGEQVVIEPSMMGLPGALSSPFLTTPSPMLQQVTTPSPMLPSFSGGLLGSGPSNFLPTRPPCSVPPFVMQAGNTHVPHLFPANPPAFNRGYRIEFPIFDGSGSIKGWLFQCEQCFLMNGVMEEHKTQTASVYVKGKALQWMEFYMRGRGRFPPWPET